MGENKTTQRTRQHREQDNTENKTTQKTRQHREQDNTEHKVDRG